MRMKPDTASFLRLLAPTAEAACVALDRLLPLELGSTAVRTAKARASGGDAHIDATDPRRLHQ